jgi:medium-chain acyl-[acyl-carrier-protein] hydrolase
MEPLVTALAEALRPFLDRPFALFGHSLGALVSFELARRLQAQSGPLPRHLFVSGKRAPQCPQEHAPRHALPEAEFRAELRKIGGTPEEVLNNEDLLRLLTPTLRADFALYETYSLTDGPPLECPVIVFGGDQDPWVRIEHLEAWQVHTRGPFRVQEFPGDHFFLHPSESQLLEALARELSA